jgi:catechol 2,3-dioxygenase-like lactoylglutathione lyase family enzyme
MKNAKPGGTRRRVSPSAPKRAGRVLSFAHNSHAATPDPSGLGAEFRFSVPVLRVKDVRATAAWYRKHLGFTASTFPERAPHDFAILARDSVQLLVRRSDEPGWRGSVAHSGWDLYIWVDGADFDKLEVAAKRAEAIVRPRRTMGAHIVEIEVRDPDGYVICIGGPIRVAVLQA